MRDLVSQRPVRHSVHTYLFRHCVPGVKRKSQPSNEVHSRGCRGGKTSDAPKAVSGKAREDIICCGGILPRHEAFAAAADCYLLAIC